MKLYRVLALAALVLFTAIGVLADGVSTDDFRVIVGSGGDPGGPSKCGKHFFKITTVNGGGIMNCVNDSDENLIELIIKGTAQTGSLMFGPGLGVLCGTVGSPTNNPNDLFRMCSMTIQSKNSVMETVTITLFDPVPSIPSGGDFFINLNDNADMKGKHGNKGNWFGSLTVIPIIAPVPEPGTITLFLMGLGGVWFWGKRHASKSNA